MVILEDRRENMEVKYWSLVPTVLILSTKEDKNKIHVSLTWLGLGIYFEYHRKIRKEALDNRYYKKSQASE